MTKGTRVKVRTVGAQCTGTIVSPEQDGCFFVAVDPDESEHVRRVIYCDAKELTATAADGPKGEG